MSFGEADITKKIEGRIDDLTRRLAPDMGQADALLLDRLSSQSALTHKIAHHLISSGGKRLRPMVVLASAYLGHIEDIAPAIKMAAAVELMHTATLLHDDVVDESAKRRNRPTAHILWGNPAAILVGDFLLGRAFEMMVEVGSLDALRILSRSASIIAEGEVRQLDLKGAIDIDEKQMMEIVAAKTASLFSAASEVGAILADCDDERRQAIKNYGYYLGMAFQLMDDALDYDGASALFGKNIGGDFFEGKITLPMILCWRQGTASERQFWEDRVSDPKSSKPSHFKKACKLIKDYDCLKITHDYAMDYATQARKSLSIFPNNQWRGAFEDIADFCVLRSF